MSTTVMSACWPLQMPPTQKAVIVSMADNANDSGECYPSMAYMAMRTCFSERAVQRAIQWLEDHHALTADRTNGRHTRYVLTPDRYAPLSESHPCQKVTGVRKSPASQSTKPLSESTEPLSQVPSNQEQKLKAKKDQKHAPATPLPSPPEWLGSESWAGFVAMRSRIRHPLTEYAARLVLRELATLRDAHHDPTACLDQSTRNGWRDVFALREKTGNAHAPQRKLSPVERIRANAAAAKAAANA